MKQLIHVDRQRSLYGCVVTVREGAFRHEALFYDGEDEFLSGTLPFVRRGRGGERARADRGRRSQDQASGAAP